MNRVLAACLASLALIVAACGGSGTSKADYEKRVSAAGSTLATTFSDMGSAAGNSHDTAAIAKTLETGAAALNKAAEDLGGVEPPSDIQAPHNDMVKGLRDLAAEFHKGASTASGEDVTNALSKLQDSEAAKMIADAGEKISAKGYNIG